MEMCIRDRPYIIHPLSVAYILAELQMDLPGVIAALLHDVVEDTEYTLSLIHICHNYSLYFKLCSIMYRKLWIFSL